MTIIPSDQHCPHCGGIMRRDGNTPAGRQRYECPDCGRKTSTPTRMTTAQLPAYLRRLREQRGYTQAAVSEHVGHETDWLAQVEDGVTILSIIDLFALADTYGLRPSELIEGYEQAARQRRPRKAK